MRQLAPRAERVDRRRADPKVARDAPYGEQIFLDLSWTQRLVLLRCGMGDSGIGAWYGPEWN